MGKSTFELTIRGGDTPECPFVPKIWVDLAANIMQIPYSSVINDSCAAMKVVVEAGLATGVDAVRLFFFPERVVELRGGQYAHMSDGHLLGNIDIQGGWATKLSDEGYFDFRNPEHVLNAHIFSHPHPIINTESDALRLRIPEVAEIDALYGRSVEESIALAGDELYCIGDCGSGTLAFCVSFMGMNQTMLNIIDSPELLHTCMAIGTEISIRRAAFFLAKGINILRLNDSVANMSVISPSCWRDLVKPHFMRFCSAVHSLDYDAKIYCHICGNITPIVEDLVECGFDCIAPLDTLSGLSIREIRSKVPKETVLMGGINPLSFVTSTPAEICSEAYECIRQGRHGGGFILGSGCVVPRSARRENIEAVVKACREPW